MAAVVTWATWGEGMLLSLATPTTALETGSKSSEKANATLASHEVARPPQSAQQASSGDDQPPERLGARVDPQAEAIQPVDSPSGTSADRHLVLPDERPVRIETLDVRSGSVVRAPHGRRATLLIPASGATIRATGVRFSGIDFVATGDSRGEGKPMITLAADDARFDHCSFQPLDGVKRPAAAIRWIAGRDSAGENPLSTGILRISDCMVRGVSTAVQSSAGRAMLLEFSNVLHLGSGPLVRLRGASAVDEPLTLSLSRVTLRGGGALLRWRTDELPDAPGKLTIRAADCVFAPQADAALLEFSGPEQPGPLLRRTEWLGHGSLLTPEAVVAAWIGAPGQRRALDDSQLPIAGLVRSRLRFAGKPDGGPASSQLTSWQAPLRSETAPGIVPERLSPSP